MKKKGIIITVVAIVIVLLLCIGVFITLKLTKMEKTHKEIQEGNDIIIVPTMRNIIGENSFWCGTFQLIWNDLKNDIANKNIIFLEGQPEMVNYLNLGEFDTSMISDDLYYKKYGLKTLELKSEIEKEIYKKFKQKSDILDQFDWSEEEISNEDNDRYFLYVMLYRKFDFLNAFDKLNNDKFGQYDDIQYFGIDEKTKSKVRNQIEVLYYYSKDDFAIKINTKTDDEVIFCKDPYGDTFSEIYENMNYNASNYGGSKSLEDIDEFKAPYINIDITKEYKELYEKTFTTDESGLAKGKNGKIEKALQTIQLTLNEKGGEIKSEAAMDVMITTAINDSSKSTPRYFYVDDTFAIFIKEKDKDMPYFAGKIEDITKFQ